jgi:hypothetical protein
MVNGILIPYTKDLDGNILFQQFVQTTPHLFKLKFSSQHEAQKAMQAINKTPISEIKPGDSQYLRDSLKYLSSFLISI